MDNDDTETNKDAKEENMSSRADQYRSAISSQGTPLKKRPQEKKLKNPKILKKTPTNCL